MPNRRSTSPYSSASRKKGWTSPIPPVPCSWRGEKRKGSGGTNRPIAPALRHLFLSASRSTSLGLTTPFILTALLLLEDKRVDDVEIRTKKRNPHQQQHNSLPCILPGEKLRRLPAYRSQDQHDSQNQNPKMEERHILLHLRSARYLCLVFPLLPPPEPEQPAAQHCHHDDE